MRQRFERVSAFCYIRGRAHIRDFAKGLFFRADPSLRAGTHFVSWRTLSRGRAHIRDFFKKQLLLKKS